MTDLVLHMFASSHYNEKARWALDWKRLPHRRVTHLPGPHIQPMLELTGQTQVPVLTIDGRAIVGSDRIVDELERAFPERPLYPADPAARTRALDVQRRFDDEVGPAVRTVVFAAWLEDLDYLCAVLARTHPEAERAAYRAKLPKLAPLIAQVNGVEPESVARASARVREALDETARLVESTGQIVGSAFTVADLAAAALLAPLARLTHPDMAQPASMPEGMAEFHAQFAPHPAIAWVRAQYATRRPAPMAA